jgi:phage-related protein
VLHLSFQGAVDRLYSYQYSIRVSKDEPLPIVFYRTSGGDEPVRDWLLSLPADARKEIGGDIRNVQDGWPLGKPYVDGFGSGLYEVRTSHRGQQYRVFFTILEETMVLLHGFQKKTQKTPAAEIKLARRRQKEVMSS